MRAKYTDIAKTLETRLQGGDYVLTNLPAERRIAEEFGVSHMTARRAVKHLLNRGLLSRPSGRAVQIGAETLAKQQLRICCVLPAFPANSFQNSYRALNRVVAARHGITRAVTYMHEEDPIIQQALVGDFTGVFMIPPHQPSQLLLDHMARNRHRLVTLWHDHTDIGVPCVEAGPASGITKLIEMLAGLGHRRIDCLNTQPDDSVVRARIKVWRQALTTLGLQGDLYDLPVEPFGEAGLAARDHMRRLLQTHRLTGSAMFCVTTSIAVGACRALYERKIEVGKQYSVCGFGEMTIAELHSPSLTAVEPSDQIPYLNMGLDWILSEGKLQTESLLFQPSETKLWIGESTGPVQFPGF